MCEDDKHVLVHTLVGLRIDDGLLDFRLIHVEIAPEGTPENSFECCNPLSRDDTGNKANVHCKQGSLRLDILVTAMLLNILKQWSVIGHVNRLTDIFGMDSSLHNGSDRMNKRHQAAYPIEK